LSFFPPSLGLSPLAFPAFSFPVTRREKVIANANFSPMGGFCYGATRFFQWDASPIMRAFLPLFLYPNGLLILCPRPSSLLLLFKPSFFLTNHKLGIGSKRSRRSRPLYRLLSPSNFAGEFSILSSCLRILFLQP